MLKKIPMRKLFNPVRVSEVLTVCVLWIFPKVIACLDNLNRALFNKAHLPKVSKADIVISVTYLNKEKFRKPL